MSSEWRDIRGNRLFSPAPNGFVGEIDVNIWQELEPTTSAIHTARMTVSSRLRVGKSETRDMAEHDRIVRSFQTQDWHMSNATFFTAFVVIAALLAVIALFVR